MTLYVESGFQCFDTETSLAAVTVEEKGEFDCPNVFTPNLSSGTGGYVDETSYNNDVFHCFAKGLNNYRLEIYNRLGIMMFESDDINVGWDGYFDNKLAPEGVYVYRITGTYNNGQEFNKVGSVMIIYSE